MELLLGTGSGNSSSVKRPQRIMSRRKYSGPRIMCGSPVAIRRKSMPIVRLGGGKRVLWRIRSVPKFRSIKLLSSVPLKLWNKLKNAYTNMMMNLAGSFGGSTGNAFAVKTTSSSSSGAQMDPLRYDKDEFEKRLIFEIYKSIVASHH